MKLSETQIMILGGALMAAFLFGKDFILGGGGAPQPQQNVAIRIDQQRVEQQRAQQKQVELPTGEQLDPALVEQETQLFQEAPFGDEELKYSVRLPKTWERSQFDKFGIAGQAEYEILTNIARYFGPLVANIHPFFWLEAQRIHEFTTAKIYMDSYLRDRSLVPSGVKVHNNNDVEALFLATEDRITYVVRARFIINGDTVVVARMAVPEVAYKQFAEWMGVTMSSFRMENLIKRKPATVTEGRLLNIVRFDHFNTWRMAKPRDTGALSAMVELFNTGIEGSANGMIIIRAVKRNLRTEMDRVAMDFEAWLFERGYTIVDKTEPETLTHLIEKENYATAEERTYRIGVNMLNYMENNDFGVLTNVDDRARFNMRLTTLDNGNYIVQIAMIALPEDARPELWAKNNLAYDSLINSMNIRGQLRLRRRAGEE